jgi:serine/threonine-protein kinase SRPK3
LITKLTTNPDQFKFPELIPKNLDLESDLLYIKGEEKRMFLNFITRMLRWRPEDQSSAEELLSDPWLEER